MFIYLIVTLFVQDVQLQTSGCGERHVSPTLISQGRTAERGEFPWHVGVYKTERGTFRHQCGGSLITNKIVVTAAQCFTNVSDQQQVLDMDLYRVLLGKHRLGYDLADAGAQNRRLTNVTIPRDYIGREGFYLHDVAVVRLDKKVDFTANIQAICVDWTDAVKRTPLVVGNVGIIAGWGYTSNQTLGAVLQWAEMPWVSKDACRKSLTGPRRSYLSFDKLCAGHLQGGSRVCKGDLGGGLAFLNRTSRRYYLRGVASINFGELARGGCHDEHYSGFSDVSVFVDFIKESLKN